MFDLNILSNFTNISLESKIGYHYVWQWLCVPVIIIIGMFSRLLIRYFLKKIKKILDNNSFEILSMCLEKISKSIINIFCILLMFLLAKIVGYSQGFTSSLFVALKIAVSVNIFIATYNLTSLIDVLIKKFVSDKSALKNPIIITFVQKIFRVIIIILIPLVIIQNLGVNVASVLAGLGLGGLAFALAAKDTLANLFGSIMIYLDKPYNVGDWVVIGKNEGIIEEVGLRSTRIRTFYDSVIVIPNSDVVLSAIDNFGKRKYRRFKTILKFNPLNKSKKIHRLIIDIKKYLSNHANIAKDAELHVVLFKVEIECWQVLIYLFLDVKDWAEELETKQNMYMDIIDMAGNMGIELAYPKKTVYLDNIDIASQSVLKTNS